jgi:hypothetical protein
LNLEPLNLELLLGLERFERLAVNLELTAVNLSTAIEPLARLKRASAIGARSRGSF